MLPGSFQNNFFGIAANTAALLCLTSLGTGGCFFHNLLSPDMAAGIDGISADLALTAMSCGIAGPLFFRLVRNLFLCHGLHIGIGIFIKGCLGRIGQNTGSLAGIALQFAADHSIQGLGVVFVIGTYQGHRCPGIIIRPGPDGILFQIAVTGRCSLVKNLLMAAQFTDTLLMSMVIAICIGLLGITIVVLQLGNVFRIGRIAVVMTADINCLARCCTGGFYRPFFILLPAMTQGRNCTGNGFLAGRTDLPERTVFRAGGFLPGFLVCMRCLFQHPVCLYIAAALADFLMVTFLGTGGIRMAFANGMSIGFASLFGSQSGYRIVREVGGCESHITIAVGAFNTSDVALVINEPDVNAVHIISVLQAVRNGNSSSTVQLRNRVIVRQQCNVVHRIAADLLLCLLVHSQVRSGSGCDLNLHRFTQIADDILIQADGNILDLDFAGCLQIFFGDCSRVAFCTNSGFGFTAGTGIGDDAVFRTCFDPVMRIIPGNGFLITVTADTDKGLHTCCPAVCFPGQFRSIGMLVIHSSLNLVAAGAFQNLLIPAAILFCLCQCIGMLCITFQRDRLFRVTTGVSAPVDLNSLGGTGSLRRLFRNQNPIMAQRLLGIAADRTDAGRFAAPDTFHCMSDCRCHHLLRVGKRLAIICNRCRVLRNTGIHTGCYGFFHFLNRDTLCFGQNFFSAAAAFQGHFRSAVLFPVPRRRIVLMHRTIQRMALLQHSAKGTVQHIHRIRRGQLSVVVEIAVLCDRVFRILFKERMIQYIHCIPGIHIAVTVYIAVFITDRLRNRQGFLRHGRQYQAGQQTKQKRKHSYEKCCLRFPLFHFKQSFLSTIIVIQYLYIFIPAYHFCMFFSTVRRNFFQFVRNMI